jgi:2'-5' RNA ligase
VAREPEAGTVGVTGDRLFLGIELDDETRHEIAAHLDAALDGRRLPGKTIPIANWHLTLRFLGPTTAVQRDRILANLDQQLAVEPFRVRFGELGGFPRRSRASVLWLGVEGDTDRLDAVAAVCDDAAVDAGFEMEGRPFHPHLTLARIRPPVDIRPFAEAVPPARITLEVSSVTLFRSVLGNGPARYESVDRVEL